MPPLKPGWAARAACFTVAAELSLRNNRERAEDQLPEFFPTWSPQGKPHAGCSMDIVTSHKQGPRARSQRSPWEEDAEHAKSHGSLSVHHGLCVPRLHGAAIPPDGS